MDTRSKIIGLAAARALTGRKRIASHFDVLKPSHLRRLQILADAHGPLVAFILDPPTPLLSRQARAELAAGLAMIEFVVLETPEDLTGIEVVEEDTPALIRHVLERYGR